LENANDDTRRVVSSRISVRVIGGSARWLQFLRSQSRQLTPIGVPSAFLQIRARRAWQYHLTLFVTKITK
jgi:hypothetical protein